MALKGPSQPKLLYDSVILCMCAKTKNTGDINDSLWKGWYHRKGRLFIWILKVVVYRSTVKNKALQQKVSMQVSWVDTEMMPT